LTIVNLLLKRLQFFFLNAVNKMWVLLNGDIYFLVLKFNLHGKCKRKKRCNMTTRINIRTSNNI